MLSAPNGEVKMAMYMIRLRLELDEPSGVYTVTSPDVPGLVTEGSTPEEITHNVQEALAGLLEVWADLGMEVPQLCDNPLRLK
jgi:antitoxin HicB